MQEWRDRILFDLSSIENLSISSSSLLILNQILSIQEFIQGSGQILDRKPDLILLNLNLLHTGGYSVCQFLRNIPAFKNTPITAVFK